MVELYGPHLGPPLISAAPLHTYPTTPNFKFIEPLLNIGMNLKK